MNNAIFYPLLYANAWILNVENKHRRLKELYMHGMHLQSQFTAGYSPSLYQSLIQLLVYSVKSKQHLASWIFMVLKSFLKMGKVT